MTEIRRLPRIDEPPTPSAHRGANRHDQPETLTQLAMLTALAALGSSAVRRAARDSHDSDDLLHGWRIGRIPKALVARGAAAVIPGQGRRRSATASSVKQDTIDHGRQRPRAASVVAIPRLPVFVHCDSGDPQRLRAARFGSVEPHDLR